MFDSAAAVVKTVALPVVSRALFDLSAYAYAAADHLEILAGRCAAASWRAAAGPAPAAARLPPEPPPINLTTPAGRQALLERAAREGRVQYTPVT